MDDGRAHIVVAVRRGGRVLVFLERDGVDLAAAVDRDARGKGVRLGNFLDRFQITAAGGHGEDLARPIRAHGLDRHVLGGGRHAGKRQAEARRHAVLEDFERQRPGVGLQSMGLIVLVGGVRVGEAMAVLVAVLRGRRR